MWGAAVPRSLVLGTAGPRGRGDSSGEGGDGGGAGGSGPCYTVRALRDAEAATRFCNESIELLRIMCGGLAPRRLLDILSFMDLWLYTEDIQNVVGSGSWSADRIFNQHPELARRAQALFAKMAEPFHGDPSPVVGLGGAPACKHLPSDAVTVAALVDHPSCGLRFATCFLAHGNPQERLARFTAVDDGYSLLGKAATENPGFVQHQFVNKLNDNPLTEADIAAIKRGQVRGGATDWSGEVRLARDAPEGMTKWGWAGALGGALGGPKDWSDEVRLARDAPEGMTKWEWAGATD
ncbi:hypothetical protein B484DRAFT_392837, partial [Ochromonadaceae sp. CCMP2298]